MSKERSSIKGLFSTAGAEALGRLIFLFATFGVGTLNVKNGEGTGLRMSPSGRPDLKVI